MPLLGKQPEITEHLRKELLTKYLPETPTSIVVLSAHWECPIVSITSSTNPPMLYDYSGFPPESYQYQYPAPGSAELANKIQGLLEQHGIKSQLDDKRGFDHGVFVPLMLMYPNPIIPVVCVSLDASLSIEKNLEIGSALQSLREEGVLILGSGYTFHNMDGFFNPTNEILSASAEFNTWLKETMTSRDDNDGVDAMVLKTKLLEWEKAPCARLCHPREEHLLPLFMTAAAAGWNSKAEVIYESTELGITVSGYLFH